MGEWTPISKIELLDDIQTTESGLNGAILIFWQLIKIDPEKWRESVYGDDGGGFWAVGLIGNKVIWFNDIEEGFNISNYSIHGQIDDYNCNQDKLDWVIQRLYHSIEFGNPKSTVVRAAPKSLSKD